jgi:hypothetical protein
MLAAAQTPPVWQQYLLSYGLGRVYDATIGPSIRGVYEHAIGHPTSRGYVPPNTPGFLVRDLLYGGMSLVLGQNLSRIMNRGGTNLLTTSMSMWGATAQAASKQAMRGALMRMAGMSVASTVAFTAFDGLFGTWIGPEVERGVNRIFGKDGHTDHSKSGVTGVPGHTMSVTVEQSARNIARNISGSFAYTAALLFVGNPLTRSIMASIPGTGGVLAGALAASASASLIGGAVGKLTDPIVCEAAQQAVRGVKRLLHMPLDPTGNADYKILPGDRVSGAAKGVAVPFATSMLTGQQAAFIAGLAARHR